MRDVRGVFAGFFALAVASRALGARRARRRRLADGPRRRGRGARSRSGCTASPSASSSPAWSRRSSSTRRSRSSTSCSSRAARTPSTRATDQLVQLFPFDFWSETTIVLGVVDPRRSPRSSGSSPRRLRPAGPGDRGGAPPRRRAPLPTGEPGRDERRPDRPDPRLRGPAPPLVAVHRRDHHRDRRGAADRLPAAITAPVALGRSASLGSLGFMLTVVAHELAHAVVARRDGQRTATSSSSTSSARRRPSTSIASTPADGGRRSRSPGRSTSVADRRSACRRSRLASLVARCRPGRPSPICSRSSAPSTSSSPR